jgi:hypothetical protein
MRSFAWPHCAIKQRAGNCQPWFYLRLVAYGFVGLSEGAYGGPETSPLEGVGLTRRRIFVSEVFRFEILGFEHIDEDFYKVYFRDVEIGEFDAEALRFRPIRFMR